MQTLLRFFICSLLVFPNLGFAQLSESLADPSTNKEGKKNFAVNEIKSYTPEQALEISQSALGNQMGQYIFQLPDGTDITSKELLGKPLIISMIYTSCYHICPTTTENLNRVVEKAKEVLGEDSFNVVTIGFDSKNDTPEAMASFASNHTSLSSNWRFLSLNETTNLALSRDLGFVYAEAPHGFDHIIQATIVDKNGKVFRQVYGMRPQTPHFVEPIKNLVFGTPEDESFFSALTNKVRLFCTIYDPAQDRYYFNYSVFVGVLVGLIFGSIFITIFIREWRYSSQKEREKRDNNSN